VRTVELAFTASSAICRAILSRRVRGELRRVFPELTAELSGRFNSTAFRIFSGKGCSVEGMFEEVISNWICPSPKRSRCV
jgi:hypothetical protein